MIKTVELDFYSRDYRGTGHSQDCWSIQFCSPLLGVCCKLCTLSLLDPQDQTVIAISARRLIETQQCAARNINTTVSFIRILETWPYSCAAFTPNYGLNQHFNDELHWFTSHFQYTFIIRVLSLYQSSKQIRNKSQTTVRAIVSKISY